MSAIVEIENQGSKSYFELIRSELAKKPDGMWLGREEHQMACKTFALQGVAIASELSEILEREPSLVLRSEALRIAALTNLRRELLPTIDRFLGRAGYYPQIGSKMEALKKLWQQTQPAMSLPIVALRTTIENLLWFGWPGEAARSAMPYLSKLADLGEPGLFAIDQILGEALSEAYLMASDRLALLQYAAELFVKHKYFEGVQIFFDFLSDCKPLKPDRAALSAIGSVLKAVRKLRPYRYPQWAAPLRRFVEHFRSIKQHGRAAEANMLIILITTTSAEEALLLDDDELVDLLRGRRDNAYTEPEIAEVAELCDALISAERKDHRIYHIRGWLAARLEGPSEAVQYFQSALEIEPSYVYSHLALASIYEMQGREHTRNHHLSSSCNAHPTLISCHRKYGEVLQQRGYDQDALDVYYRGLELKPDQKNILELEEYFGCLASIARIYADYGDVNAALEVLDRMNHQNIESIFGARFCQHNRVIIDLLHKGLRDLQAEIKRMSKSDPSSQLH